MYSKIENLQIFLKSIKTVKFVNSLKNVVSIKRSESLLKIRIGFYIAAFTHLLTVSTMLLSIDFTKEEDTTLHKYQEVRWRLITTWFNLLSMAYMPMCVYCDWRELRGEVGIMHVKLLNRIRHALFTSIILPSTFFADILFWRLWTKDRDLIAPDTIDHLIPYWTQHSMHTISLFVVILDLVLVPRRRPKNLLPGIFLMYTFLSAYGCMLGISILQGQYVYPVLKGLSFIQLYILFPIHAIFEFIFYYTAQWFVVDLFWRPNSLKAN